MRTLLALLFFCSSTLWGVSVRGVQYEKGTLQVLDQQKWPQTEEWIEVQTPEHLVALIQSHQVQGSQMISLAGLFSLAKLAEQRGCICRIKGAANLLKTSFPMETILTTYLDRVLAAVSEGANSHSAVIALAEAIYREAAASAA